MPNPVITRLLRKKGNENILNTLKELSLSDLNSLLLEVFRSKAAGRPPRELLKAYKSNRFVLPSIIDPVSFIKMELPLLEDSADHGFQMMELSPLAPLGSCSAIGLTDQNKVVSALRGVEVVSDATNVLALHASLERMQTGFNGEAIHFAAAHRHTRAQAFSAKGFFAHFKIFCALSAGKDTGGFTFEMAALKKHLAVYCNFLSAQKAFHQINIIIKGLSEEGHLNSLAPAAFKELSKEFTSEKISFSYVDVPRKDHQYYNRLRFSIDVVCGQKTYNVGDGGFVDWAQKLTGNRKEKMFTSGIGTELVFKLVNNMI